MRKKVDKKGARKAKKVGDLLSRTDKASKARGGLSSPTTGGMNFAPSQRFKTTTSK